MAEPVTTSKRATAYKVVSILFFVAAAVMMWGVLSLLFGWFDEDAGGIHKVHTIGWGVVTGLVLTGALGAGTFRASERISALQQAFVFLAAVAIGGALSQSWGLVGFSTMIVLPALLILLALHPARNEFFARPNTFSWPLATCAILGGIPLVNYAWNAATLQRNGVSTDPHVADDHWAIMASAAIALVLCGLLASVRTRGWPFVAWCAGLGAAALGVASVTFPDHAGSFGSAWGIVAIAGAVVYLGEVEMERRRVIEDVSSYAGRRRHIRAA